MTPSNKFVAGAPFPAFRWPLVSGGDLDLSAMGGWRVLIVYRGKHCPRCTAYFKILGGLLDEFAAAGIKIATLSADPEGKASESVAEHGWRFPVAYGMSVEQMRSLGLYISEPRSAQETDRPFAEPAVFVINPDNNVQVAAVSNASYARPDLASLLSGLKFTIENKLPVRGTLS